MGAVQVTQFKGVQLDQPVDKLIWRGGIVMVSQDDTFGGLSGIAFTSKDQHLAFVSDLFAEVDARRPAIVVVDRGIGGDDAKAFRQKVLLCGYDLVGAAVTSTLSGADPATELKKAHEQFRPILERSEKA